MKYHFRDDKLHATKVGETRRDKKVASYLMKSSIFDHTADEK